MEEKNQQETEENRLKQYKNVTRHEDMRRRRTECSVELRKQKKEELMMKRRNLQEEDDEESAPTTATGELCDNTAHAGGPIRMSFPEVVKILQSSPTLEQTRDCFESIRRALSRNKNPPVDEAIESGLIYALVQALAVEDDKVRFEASWALTNIVSGTSEQTMKAVEAGATQPLIALCVHPDAALSEQALWAVANIAGDCPQLRDLVIESGGVEALMTLTRASSKLPETFLRTLAWSFSNLCRHKNPHAPLAVLRVLISGIAILLGHSDKQTRIDACWALSYLTDGPDEQMMLAVDAGVLPCVAAMLKESDGCVAPALRVLGNMATGDDLLTQVVVDLGVLKVLGEVMGKAKSATVVKECCWLISNIFAGNQQQMQRVIDEGLVPVVVSVVEKGDYKSQHEASWALANLAAGGSPSQLLAAVDCGVIPALCNLLRFQNADVLCNALETMKALLGVVAAHRPEQINEITLKFEENDGLELLEKLQDNKNEKVYQLSYHIVSDYFMDEEGTEDGVPDENAPPCNFKF